MGPTNTNEKKEYNFLSFHYLMTNAKEFHVIHLDIIRGITRTSVTKQLEASRTVQDSLVQFQVVGVLYNNWQTDVI